MNRLSRLASRSTSSTRMRLVGGIGALALAVTLSACGSTTSSGDGQQGGMGGMSGMDHGSMSSSSASSTATGRAGDVMFARMMIPHHQQAVEMADLALTKAQSPQVKKLAEQIKAAQSPEIATMNGWLTSWGVGATTGTSGTSSTDGVNGMGHGDGMMSAADMTSLANASGASFDRLWLTMMVAHHEGAITMAKQVLATTSDPAVTQLADSIVSGQTAEIATMKGLLA